MCYSWKTLVNKKKSSQWHTICHFKIRYKILKYRVNDCLSKEVNPLNGQRDLKNICVALSLLTNHFKAIDDLLLQWSYLIDSMRWQLHGTVLVTAWRCVTQFSKCSRPRSLAVVWVLPSLTSHWQDSNQIETFRYVLLIQDIFAEFNEIILRWSRLHI